LTFESWPALATKAQQGDHAAADELARELRSYLVRFFKKQYSNPQRVEDAVQDALFRIFKHLPKLKDPHSIHAWVKQIAKRVYVDSAGCPYPSKREIPSESLALQERQFSGHEVSGETAQPPTLVSFEALDEEERETIPDSSLPLETHYVEHVDPANHVRALCRSRGLSGEMFLAMHEENLSARQVQERYSLNSENQVWTRCSRHRAWLQSQMEAYLSYPAA